jgi:hypothetical protein
VQQGHEDHGGCPPREEVQVSSRSAFGTHLTTVTFAFDGAKGLSRQERHRAAQAEAQERFPTNMGVNTSYASIDAPSDSQIEVRVSIKSSEVARYYR